MGPSPPRPDSVSAGGADDMAGKMGSPQGRVGSVYPFFLYFSFPFLSHRNTHTLFFRSFLFFLSHKHTDNYSVSLSLSVCGLPHSPSPTPLICSGICGDASPAQPEMPKMGT